MHTRTHTRSAGQVDNFRFVNMISMATAKLKMEKIWNHVKIVRKEYYRKSLTVWPDKCLGFLEMPGLECTEFLKKSTRGELN